MANVSQQYLWDMQAHDVARSDEPRLDENLVKLAGFAARDGNVERT
jgi:hypothetical protein